MKYTVSATYLDVLSCVHRDGEPISYGDIVDMLNAQPQFEPYTYGDMITREKNEDSAD